MSPPCPQFHHRTSSLMSSPVSLPIVPCAPALNSRPQEWMFRGSGSHCRKVHNNFRMMEEQEGNILTPTIECPRETCENIFGHYVLNTSFEQHYDTDSLCVERKPDSTICTGFVMRGRQSCVYSLVVCWLATRANGRRLRVAKLRSAVLACSKQMRSAQLPVGRRGKRSCQWHTEESAWRLGEVRSSAIRTARPWTTAAA